VGAVERVRELVEPLIEREGVELYDVELESGILQIMVDRPGGIDVDTIGTLSQGISDALDVADPIPDSRYLLEVTSPGIERKLRLPEHFAAQVDNVIAVKVQRGVEGDRRFEGVLKSADGTGVEVSVAGKDGDVTRRLEYEEIESARLVFQWDTGRTASVRTASSPAGKAGKHNSITSKKKASAR
jgi:ribosome maturation factor RimP